MIHTNGPHAVINDSITKPHGMHCHFFHRMFQRGLSCFHFEEKLLTVADLKTISQTFKEEQRRERQNRRGRREGVKWCEWKHRDPCGWMVEWTDEGQFCFNLLLRWILCIFLHIFVSLTTIFPTHSWRQKTQQQRFKQEQQFRRLYL